MDIKAVAQPMPQQRVQEQVYEIPVMREAELEDGSKVQIVAQRVRTTKAQLQAQISNFQKQIDDLNAKLLAITSLEAVAVKSVGTQPVNEAPTA
jgi:hypothetical protein